MAKGFVIRNAQTDTSTGYKVGCEGLEPPTQALRVPCSTN